MASKPYAEKRRGRWVCKYKPDPDGPWVVVSLGKDPRISKDHAPTKPPQSVIDRHREFCEIEYNVRHGLRPAPARAKGLAGYLEVYVDVFAATHKVGSTRHLRRHVKRFAEFASSRGAATVQGVTRSICRDYLELRIKTIAHDTLKTEMRFLMPIWTRAVDDGLMLKNPWTRLKVPGKSTRSAPVFWTGEEVARIAAACSKSWQSDLVMVLANTGLRISTALALEWSWIDWAEGRVNVPKVAAAREAGVKTAYSLAMNDVARDILQRRHFGSRGRLVFPNPRGGGPIGYDTAGAAIKKAIRKAGVKEGSAHDLRHSYARHLVAIGKPINVVQSQLGHSTLAMTQIYTKVEDARDVAASLEDTGFGVVKPGGPKPPKAPRPSRRRPPDPTGAS
jgi:integrase